MTRCPRCDHENPGAVLYCRQCGSQLPQATGLDPEFERELRECLRTGHKIKAIQLVKERTGLGLKEAKEAVESLELSSAVQPLDSLDPDVAPQLLELLQAGRKIEAIKVLKERTGWGLKEAKGAVEALAIKQGLATPQGKGCLSVLLICLALGGLLARAAGPGPVHADKRVTVSPAEKDATGILTHRIESEYQAGQTEIHVLLPDRLVPDRRYPVVYVLPVEAPMNAVGEMGWGEILKHDLHNKHQAIFVAPTFSHLPWYADHPSRKEIRQESYFVKVVVPAVEKHYPVRPEPSGRLLLGFSKSGYGAFTLLLRHPHLFGRAVAWDSPVTKQRPDQFGMGEIYSTQENFKPYCLTRLWKEKAADLEGQPCRLSLVGYGNFRDQHVEAHELMLKLKIPHDYQDGPQRPHHWNSGWVPPAVAWLLKTGDN